MSKGYYVAIYKCVKCGHTLSYPDVYRSRGVCRYCGHDSDSTIVDYNKQVIFVDEEKPGLAKGLHFVCLLMLFIIAVIAIFEVLIWD